VTLGSHHPHPSLLGRPDRSGHFKEPQFIPTEPNKARVCGAVITLGAIGFAATGVHMISASFAMQAKQLVKRINWVLRWVILIFTLRLYTKAGSEQLFPFNFQLSAFCCYSCCAQASCFNRTI